MFSRKVFFSVACQMVMMFGAVLLFAGPAQASKIERDRAASIAAGDKCLGDLRKAVRSKNASGPNVSCDIPIILTEAELDNILRQSFDFKSLKNKAREKVKSFSRAAAKTLVNARSARCMLTIRLNRQKLVHAASLENTDLEVQPQRVSCEVLTKAGKHQTVSFTFKPKLKVEDHCVKSFAPRMGEIKAPCKICWPVNLSRLYITTKVVSVWINHVGKNFNRVLNGLLERNCAL